MIFYTALTYKPVYVEQYRYLLKSIHHIYPNATPILYLLTDFDRTVLDSLWRENKNLIFVDWREGFNPSLGFDTNFIRGLRHCYQQNSDCIVSLDADMLVCKPFDEFLDNDADVTATSRGYIKDKMGRQDICFGVTIYSQRNPHSVIAFFDALEERALKWFNPENRTWFEIQTEFNNIFMMAGGELLDGYPAKHYEKHEPPIPARVGRFIFKQQEIILRVADFILLGCSYPPRYGESYIIHYKREKSSYKMLYQEYCLKKNRAVNKSLRLLHGKLIRFRKYLARQWPWLS